MFPLVTFHPDTLRYGTGGEGKGRKIMENGEWKMETGEIIQNFSFLVFIKLYNIKEILRVLFIS